MVRMMVMAAALATFGCGAAQAASVTYVFRGTVHDSSNNTGVFGRTGASSLDGLPYVARFTVTLPTPGVDIQQTSSFIQVTGGDYYGVASPVYGTLTINGITLSAGNYISQVTVFNDNFFSSYEALTLRVQHYLPTPQVRQSNYFILSAQSYNGGLISGPDPLNALETYNAGPHYGTGYFQWNDETPGGQPLNNATGSLSVEQVSVLTAPGVPEPASWALLIAGFGLTGAALRRRRALTA